MKLSPTYRMPLKRRREGKTDYRQRLKLLLSKKPRLVVRKSLKYITAQIVEFSENGDRVIASAYSKNLKKLGWNFACDNLPAAYLTGLMIGKKALEKNINEAVLDIGLHTSTKGNRIYAVVKGALDAGLKVPCNEDMLPGEERIFGQHITKNEKFKNLPEEFKRMKEKIMSG
jgi:large subunit ribosomal protein L18